MMYRIESYITSIILSYVDRYIKNFRREDVKLSLWEGDGVLYNLDLDLDVLEHELNLPFSFISGHIHQLHIHVPWTRIASESVQITINTIECVMKLKPPGPRPPMTKKKVSTEESAAPPSYIASVVNKIVCNLSITCNNLILKYVEEDIVLSMNIKTLNLTTVNKNWIREFSELTTEDLILRKLVTLTDVTICLDKRNASGRIESYLEPLLYKCSLSIRISRSYPSVNSAHVSSTRIAVHCNNITFSISEPQVSMLLRLCLLTRLAMAQTKESSSASVASVTPSIESNEPDNYNESWSGWLMGFVLYPLAAESTVFSCKPPQQKFHFGLYVERLTIDLKLLKVETSWENILEIVLGGGFLELTSNGSDWSNIQIGISSAKVVPVPDNNGEVYLECGEIPVTFMSESLFENPDMDLTQRPWEYHLATVTETLMMERAPTFYLDYLSIIEKEPCYELDQHSKHLREKQLSRFVVGPVLVRICTSLIDRVTKLKQSLYNYDYSPYTLTSTTTCSVSADELNHFRESTETEEGYFVAQNVCQFTLFGARIKIYPSDKFHFHQSSISKSGGGKSSLPYVLLKVKCVDAKWIRPAYLDRISALAAQFNFPDATKAKTNSTLSLLVVDAKVSVVVRDSEGPDLFEISNLSLGLTINNVFNKIDDSDFINKSILLLEKVTLISTKPKVMLGYEIIKSLALSSAKTSLLYNTSLLRDCRNSNDSILLELKLSEVEGKYSRFGNCECVSLKIGSAEGSTYHSKHSRELILDTTSNEEIVQVVLQRPLTRGASDLWCVAPLLAVKVRKAWVSVSPDLCLWLMYSPNNHHSARAFQLVVDPSGSGRKISSSSLSSLHRKQFIEPKPSIIDTDSSSIFSNTFSELENGDCRILSLVVSCDVSDVRLCWPSPTTNSRVVLALPSISIRSPLGRINYNPESVPLIVNNWNQDKLNLPWSVFICDVQGWTECGQTLNRLPMLAKFSLSLTIALTTKMNPTIVADEKPGVATISLCLHIDTTPVHLSFSHPQVVLVTEVCVCLNQVYCALFPPPDSDSGGGAIAPPSDASCGGGHPHLPPPPPSSSSLSLPPPPPHLHQGPTSPRSITDESNSVSNSNSNKQGCLSSLGPKLTIWLQWTLAKVSVSLYSLPLRNSPEILKFILDVDDVFMTLDVEAVYQKLKLKIATAQVKHYSRLSSRLAWKPGCYGGLVMRGNEPVDQDAGDDFLSVTITRANSANLHSKLSHSLKKSVPLSESHYVTEIITKLQPLDLVFSPLVIGKLLSIVEPIFDREDQFPLGRNFSTSPLAGPSVLNMSTSNLPLLYFDVAFIRLFLPCPSLPPNVDSSPQDTLFVQVEKVSISSEAVNPLSRKLVRSDLYTGSKTRFTTLPGSSLEDRQYQLDANLSITTGVWNEVGSHLDEDESQNPAVYWNWLKTSSGAGVSGGSHHGSTAPPPLLAPLSLSIIVAPPIITAGFIVSGLNVEVNVVSEVDLSINLEQLKLLCNLLNDGLAAFPSGGSSSYQPSEEQIITPVETTTTDSGIESFDGSFYLNKKESSDPQLSGVKSRSLSQISLSTSTSINTKRYHHRSQTVPIDILVTTKAIILKLSRMESVCLYDPLLFVLISQPYVALEKQGDVSVYKGSLYEMEIKHGVVGHMVDKLDSKSFPVTLILNKNGDTDPYKGIPPALINFKSFSQGVRPPMIEIDIGRPIKFLCKISSIDYLKELKQTIEGCFLCPEAKFIFGKALVKKSSSYNLNRSFTIKEQIEEEESIEKLKRCLQSSSGFCLTTKQVVLDIHVSNTNKPGCLLSFGGLKANTEWVESCLNLTFQLSNLCLSRSPTPLSYGSLIAGPWSLDGRLGWDPKAPSLTLRLSAGLLTFNVSQDAVDTVQATLDEFGPFLEAAKGQESVGGDETNRQVTHDKEEEHHYQDDLQAGAFQFVTSSSTTSLNHPANHQTTGVASSSSCPRPPLLPLAYQVIFPSQSQMSWAYPAPRAITKLTLMPLPINDGGVVKFSVEYLECGVWRTWVQFSSDMTSPLEVGLPRLTRVASIWRISIDNDSGNKAMTNATALAAALRVNSLYSAKLVPAFTLSLDINSFQISVVVEQKEVTKLPGLLSRYSPDSKLPNCFPAGTLFLELVKMSLTYWSSDEVDMDCELRPRLDILNPRLLVQQCCVQPFLVHLSASRHFPELQQQVGVANVAPSCPSPSAAALTWTVSLVTSRIIACVAPPTAHTLLAATKGALLTPYIVCNDTSSTIRFGQCGTCESIQLEGLQCNFYSWRSAKQNMELRFSISNLDETGWSASVSLEEESVVRLQVEDDNNRAAHLIVTVKHLSPILTQVVVSGRLLIHNMVEREIDCRVVANTISERQRQVILLPGQRAPSVVLSPTAKYSLRLCLVNNANNNNNSDGNSERGNWSGLVPLMTNNNVWLVKLPLKDKEYFSVWCQIILEEEANCPRLFVVLSPIYLLRSYLPCDAKVTIKTEGIETEVRQVVPGRGTLSNLTPYGTAAHKHILDFAIDGVETEGSSGIPLSYSLVEGKSPPPPAIPSISELIDMADSSSQHRGGGGSPLSATPWPLVAGIKVPTNAWNYAPQPNTVTNVKVRFGGDVLKITNSLLIELQPWCLMINTVGLALRLYQGSAYVASLPHFSVIAPPPLQCGFRFGIEIDGLVFQSGQIELSQNQAFFMPQISGIVPHTGSLQITLPAEDKLCCLTIQSRVVNSMRVLHATSTFSIVNVSSLELTFAAMVVSSGERKLIIPQLTDSYSVPLPSSRNDKNPVGVSANIWHSVGDGKEKRYYLLFESNGHVSTPALITQTRDTQTVLLPLRTTAASAAATTTSDPKSGIKFCNVPLTVVTNVKDGVVYVTVDDQMSPQLIVHNNTGVQLSLAKLPNNTAVGNPVDEYTDWEWRLIVPSGKSAHYHLGNTIEDNPPHVVLSRPEFTGWSSSISVVGCVSGRLVSVPHCHDLTAIVTKRGPTIHLTLNPANQRIVAASDIRSRLTQMHQTKKGPELAAPYVPSDFPVPPDFEDDTELINKDKYGLIFKCLIKGLSVTLCTESSNYQWSEVVALTLDNVTVLSQPKLQEPSDAVVERTVQIRVSEVQVDNEEYQRGGYDFGVVLLCRPDKVGDYRTTESVDAAIQVANNSQVALTVDCVLDPQTHPVIQDVVVKMSPMEVFLEDVYLVRLKEQMAKMAPPLVVVGDSRGRLPTASGGSPTNRAANQGGIVAEGRIGESANGECHPVSVSADQCDDELFNVSEPEQGGCSPEVIASTSYSQSKTGNELIIIEDEDAETKEDGGEEFDDGGANGVFYEEGLPFPNEILSSALELSRPLLLRVLSISQLNVLISLHTSTRFYIALENSPLKFAQFERFNMVTTTYRLGHALTLHYFLGAIYGTGWALGSLQLLGAPAGLARSVGAGLKSFVTMPCIGALQQGPTGFFMGVLHGSAALMKHVTAGTLTSVTKFASSWSRTLDRLTLDDEDLKYAEEMRRLRPQGLGQALKQGLTEFGVSLLGGVGGLAQQPLEYVSHGNKSLAGALGSAIVGAVTRPLSGAAELLALTGHGILSGAGWTDNHFPKYECSRGWCQTGSESSLKLSWKVLRLDSEGGSSSGSGSGESLLALVEGTSADFSSITIVVTTRRLCVVDSTTDDLIHSFNFGTISVDPDPMDPTLVNVNLLPPDNGVESYSKRRVEDFIRESRLALGAWPSPPSTPPAPLNFYLSPTARGYFLAVVDLASRHANDNGFSLINKYNM